MNDHSNQGKAIELLQQLGLKEYEAKCFVALSRLPQGTAKEISEISEVPRTRVYDATRVLETKGLIEIQHSNPQQFRAVSIDEAVETLRNEYDTRMDSLRETLRGVEPVALNGGAELTHEVWALTGAPAIRSRAHQLLEEAEEEIVLVVGDESAVEGGVFDSLRAAEQRDVSIVVGTVADEVRVSIQETLPDAEVFVSGLEWIRATGVNHDDTEIRLLLLVDRSTILVSSAHTDDGDGDEQAVFGRGFDNGLVTIVRRLMATGLLPGDDPGRSAE